MAVPVVGAITRIEAEGVSEHTSPTLPTGTVNGDILLLVAAIETDLVKTPTFTTPAGWSIVSARAEDTETSGQFSVITFGIQYAGAALPTVKWSESGFAELFLIRVSGGELSGAVLKAWSEVATVVGSISVPSVTSTAAESLEIVFCSNYWGQSATAPAGYTEHAGGTTVLNLFTKTLGAEASGIVKPTVSGAHTWAVTNITIPPKAAGGSAPVVTKPSKQEITKGFTVTPLKPVASESPTSWENPVANPLPTGLSLNTSTGEITGAVTGGPGTYTVGLKASNAHGASAEVTFEWFVGQVPKVGKPLDKNSNVGEAIAPIEVEWSGSKLEWSSTGLPAGLTLNQSGEITGTPTTAEAEHLVTIKVVSPLGGSAESSFKWTVIGIPPPVLTLGPASLRDAFPLHLTIGGEDCTFLLSEGFTFSNVDPGGYEMASFPIPKDMPQVVRGMPVKLDCGLQVAWEGRVKEIQRSLGAKTLIQCEGYGARLRDSNISMIYVDRDLTHWTGPSPQLSLEQAEEHASQGSFTVAPSPTTQKPVLTQELAGNWVSPFFPQVITFYDAGPQNSIAVVFYSLSVVNVGSPGTINHILTVKSIAAGGGEVWGTGIIASGTSAYLLRGSNPALRYAKLLQTPGATPGGEAGAQSKGQWELAVYGDHKLLRRTIGSETIGGFQTNDIAKHALKSAAGVQAGVIEEASGLIVPHAVYYTPVEVQQVISDMAKLVGWHWGVWESQTYLCGNTEPRLDFRAYPEAPTAYAMRSECEVLDVREDLAGQYNTAQVQFSEAAGNEGVAEVKVDNPILDKAGIANRTIPLSLGVSVQAAAETYGKLALEALQTQARVVGSATIKQPIHKMNGAPMAPWMLNAGLDLLRVPDLPSFDVWGKYNSLPISRVECSGSSSGITTNVEFGLGHNLMETLTAQLQEVAVLGGS